MVATKNGHEAVVKMLLAIERVKDEIDAHDEVHAVAFRISYCG
jgi:hypothetical protein